MDDDTGDPFFVYIIGTIENGIVAAPVKVGVAIDCSIRLSALQTGSAKPLGLLYALGQPTRSEAYGLERIFHLTQDEHRLSGEWFDLAPLRALKILLLLAVLNSGRSQRLDPKQWKALGLTVDEGFEDDVLPLLLRS